MSAAAALLSALALLGASAPAARLPDAGQEAHAHALFRQIRCLVCQNESIDDSDAPLAGDLRALVRADVVAGLPDAQIRRSLVDRFGEFVLLKPRVSLANLLLWFAPFALVAMGLVAFAMRARAPQDPLEPPLSPFERERVSALAAMATVPPRPRPTDTTAAM